jgi:heptaprenyl diphosphate synthase
MDEIRKCNPMEHQPQINQNQILDRYQIVDKDIQRFYLLFFVALSGSLSFIEYLIPKPVPFLRLGLANIIVILFIVRNYYKEALIIAFLRPILVSFIVGNIFSVPFWLSLGGSLLSFCTMSLFFRIAGRYISIVGISLIGAYSHITAQLFIVYLTGIMTNVSSIISIGSIMTLLAFGGGLLTAVIAIYLNKRL